jgi:ATPase components of ABC transporters with duplicated ATPase domains
MLLNRSLFTAESLAKNCLELSGGEKMRLSILILILRKQAPDLLILDEPTNNIDLASIHILTQTIKSFKGSLLVISHDREFIEEIGINMEIEL